jgi:hypothetical protein
MQNSLENLSDQEQTSLFTGESYIVFNNMHHEICVWINCDSEMAVNLSLDSFTKIVKNLCPVGNTSNILRLVNSGAYIYLDKKTCKVLRPSDIGFIPSNIPTVQDAMSFRNLQKPKMINF